MLKKYLITMQQPGQPRSRYIVKADSTFDALITIMDKMLRHPQHLAADTYLAARPATPPDVATYAAYLP